MDTQNESVDEYDLSAAYDEQQAEESKTEEVENQDTDNEPAQVELNAPEHWDKTHKDNFNSWDEGVREQYLERHKSMEGDYTRKSQERASDIKLAESLHTSLEPYRADFESQGADESQAISRLLEIHGMLKNNPGEALMYLAKQYNYSPDDVDTSAVDSDEEYFDDPAMTAMQQQMKQMQQELNRSSAAQQHAAQQSYATTLNGFISESKDGQELHPFAGELRADISKLMQSGFTQDLGTAYNMALASKPELQSKVNDRNSDIAKTIEREKHKKAVSKAENAASAGVKSSVSNMHKGEPESIRGGLEALYDSMVNQT